MLDEKHIIQVEEEIETYLNNSAKRKKEIERLEKVISKLEARKQKLQQRLHEIKLEENLIQ